MVIESIIPHPSEDDLDVVTLGPGLKCVVHKGQFKVGETVKFVPVKTVKKGIICHGMIVHEDNYMEFNTEATLITQPDLISSEEFIEKIEAPIFDLHELDPDSIDPAYFQDDAEEDAKNFAEDEG